MTNKFDTQRDDYKPKRGDSIIAPSFKAEIKKSLIGFDGIFFAQQEKIMTKQNTGVQTNTKL